MTRASNRPNPFGDPLTPGSSQRQTVPFSEDATMRRIGVGVLGLLLAAAGSVRADVVSEFTGNTQAASEPAPATQSPGVDFTSNFAVFAATGQNGTPLGIGNDPGLAT